MHRIETEFAGRTLVIETGKMAKQAAGSCLVRFGDTMVLAAVTDALTQSRDAGAKRMERVTGGMKIPGF